MPPIDAVIRLDCALAEVYRNIKQYPSATQHPHILVMRVDAPIYFANVEWIRGRIAKYKERANEDEELGPIYFIILDMAPVPFVDSTGALTAPLVHSLVCECKPWQSCMVAASCRHVVQEL